MKYIFKKSDSTAFTSDVMSQLKSRERGFGSKNKDPNYSANF